MAVAFADPRVVQAEKSSDLGEEIAMKPSASASYQILPTAVGLKKNEESRAFAQATASNAPVTSLTGCDRELLSLVAVVFTAFLLRCPYLGQTSLWLDEMYSVGTSRMPWRSILAVVLHQDSNASLYYALLHLWMGFGHSEAIVRLLSVLLGSGTILVLYTLGSRLYGKSAGLVASLLLALNGFHIQYSQEARTYTLVVLLTTLSSLLFVLSIESPTRTHWLLYALASVFAIYAHVFGILVVASHWGSLVFLRRREVPWKGLLASTSIIGVLASPLAILIFIRSTEPNAPLAWAPKPTFHHIYTLFYSLVGLADFSGAPEGKPVVAAYFLVCCVALVSGIGMWRAIGRSLKSWHMGLPFACLFVPIVLTLAVSMVKPIFVNKYLLICLPFLLLLAANGIQSIKPKWVAVAVLMSTAGLTTIGLPSYYKFRARNHEWESVTAHILEQSKPGDAAIFYIAPGRLCFDYYRAKYRGANKDVHVVYPEFADENRDPIVLRDIQPMRSDLAEYVATRYHRVWVVLYHDDFAFTSGVSNRIQESLYGKYRKVQKIVTEGPWPYERVTLLLYADGTDDRDVTSGAQGRKAPVEQ